MSYGDTAFTDYFGPFSNLTGQQIHHAVLRDVGLRLRNNRGLRRFVFYHIIHHAILTYYSFSHLLQRMQVMADEDFLLGQAPQGAMATIAGTCTNFGSRPMNTSSRAPLHQRHVAHFLCAIGMSNCAIYVPFIKPRRRSTKYGAPCGGSSEDPVRMITSLSEERRYVKV